MSDNLSVTAGSGSTVGMDEVVDGTLGTVKIGFGKIMDGTLDSTNKLIINSTGEALVKLNTLNGAATAANQATEITSLASIATNTGTKADTFVTGSITTADAVVAAPSGNGVPLTGASTAGSIVSLASPGGASAWVASITGTISGTYYFEISINSTNGTDGLWINVNGRQTGLVSTTTVADYKTTITGEFRGSPAGAKYFRVRNVGGSGLSTAVTIGMGTGTGPVFLYSSVPSGTNVIGKTGIDQTTPGTTNGVQVIAALPAGTNLLGKTSIDQTTPGTTNLVAITPAQAGAGATGTTPPANASYQGVLAQTALPTAATAGNVVGALGDKYGRPAIVGSIRALKGRQQTTITASTAETTIVTAVASTFIDIYRITLANSSATPCLVTIKDSTAGTTVDNIEVPANGTAGWSGPESAAASQTTINNNWTATCGTSVTSIFITAYYVLEK